ncbi:MAG TPA: DUF2304 domain-containing protein [Candidatus Egerieimonas faecigallinarum]|nr:DUF2304 domain-containing protein [Candidatus Egerieimonas faecigallinarum]
MSIIFRIVLIVVSLGTMGYMLRKIHQAKMQIEDSLFWFLFSALLLVLSVFPQIATWATRLLGMMSTSNFIFLFIIFVLLVRMFHMTLKISQLDDRLKNFAQKMAIEENLREEQAENAKTGKISGNSTDFTEDREKNGKHRLEQ